MATSTTAAVSAPDSKLYAELALAQLRPSKTNPRRRFDDAKLQELAASIREKGVLEPLLVRPIGNTVLGLFVKPPENGSKLWYVYAPNGTPHPNVSAHFEDEAKCRAYIAKRERENSFEIVAGERRFKAAQLAKLAAVPCVIRDYSDADALECQVVENDQREDVHPLDQAAGYRALMATGRYKNVEELARKLGKSRRFVYQRMELAALAKPAAQAFSADTITATHAALLARLQPADQARGLEACFERSMGYGSGSEKRLISSRALEQWIAQHVHLNLDKAPWKKDDAKLLPGAGACTACPKRAGANPERFPDVKHANTCTDPACYQQKLQAFVQLQAKSAGGGKPVLRVSTSYQGRGGQDPAIGCGSYEEAKPGSCPHVQQALIVHEDEFDGRDRSRLGQVLTVCAEKKCKKHHRQRSSSGYDSERAQAERRGKDRARRQEMRRRDRIFKGLAETKLTKLESKDWRAVATWAVERLWHDASKRFVDAMGWELKVHKRQYGATYRDYDGAIHNWFAKLSDAEIPKGLLLLTAAADLLVNDWRVSTKDQLFAIAQRHGVDVAGISKQVAAEFAAQKKGKKKKISASFASAPSPKQLSRVGDSAVKKRKK